MDFKAHIQEREGLIALQEIPGIGKSLARDLWNLGIHAVSDLREKNPMQLYQKLNVLTDTKQDPCVLYTFRCAVYYATEKKHDQEKLKLWLLSITTSNTSASFADGPSRKWLPSWASNVRC